MERATAELIEAVAERTGGTSLAATNVTTPTATDVTKLSKDAPATVRRKGAHNTATCAGIGEPNPMSGGRVAKTCVLNILA